MTGAMGATDVITEDAEISYDASLLPRVEVNRVILVLLVAFPASPELPSSGKHGVCVALKYLAAHAAKVRSALCA